MNDAAILIVDDDMDQVSMLASMLNGLNCNVETALDGKRALEILRYQTPALVITDMVMPDISGSQIIQSIRADERLRGTKILIVTSFLRYVSEQDKALSDGVLVKPVQKAQLQQAVNDLL